MKMNFRMALFLIAPLILRPQDAPFRPIRVQNHQLGESLDEWLSINHTLEDLAAICQSRKRNDKLACKWQSDSISDIRNGKSDEMGTAGVGRDFKWKFFRNKLVQVTVTVPSLTAPGGTTTNVNVQEEFGFLVERYGAATKTGTIPYQNAYGAKWDCLEADWSMADGSMILASERILAGSQHILIIIFGSGEYLKTQSHSKPNPY
jgi:hypothetical protein